MSLITSINGNACKFLLSEYPVSKCNKFNTDCIYTINGMYDVYFSNKNKPLDSEHRILKYAYSALDVETQKYRDHFIHIFFRYNVNKYTWNEIYLHFTTQAFEEIHLFNKFCLHENFQLNRTSRFFVDLDFKLYESEQFIADYIRNLIKTLTNIVGFELEYVVTKNTDTSLTRSRHIIFTNIIMSDILQCAMLANELKDKYLDALPYHQNGGLRVLNGIKTTSNQAKVIDYCYPESLSNTIGITEFLLIQPEFEYLTKCTYRINQIPDKDYNNIFSTPLCTNSSDSDENLVGLDLKDYGLVIDVNTKKNNMYVCNRISDIDCPICHRLHDKINCNYIIVGRTFTKLGCFRSNDSNARITLKSNKFKWDEFIENCPELSYNFDSCPNTIYETYCNETAQMPTDIQGNCLYLNSPCKSGKTQMIHNYLSNNPDLSVIFITMQRHFSRDLHSRFSGLGFEIYLDEKQFNPYHNRVIVSLYSLHKCMLGKYDLVILDEVETMFINFRTIGQLGINTHRTSNFEQFIRFVNNAHLVIAMDAYISRYVLNILLRFNKSIHIYLNEFKTHKDDKIMIYTDVNNFIYEMYLTLLQGGKVVFSCAFKNKQKKIVDDILRMIDEAPLSNIKSKDIKVAVYNADMDRAKMDESIKNIDESWTVSLLTYSPSISAGINYTKKNFNRCFILGCPTLGHIQLLQSAYRCRDISSGEYHIYISNSMPTENFNKITEDDLKVLCKFNNVNMLDFNIIARDYDKDVVLANTTKNYIITTSQKYNNYSTRNFKKLLIGQFKYNGSQITVVESIDKNEKSLIEETLKESSIRRGALLDSKIANMVSNVEITDAMFNKIPDNEFTLLSGKTNKSKEEEVLCEIQTFARMFPLFNKQIYNKIAGKKRQVAKYYRYYRNHEINKKYVIESFDTSLGFLKNRLGKIDLLDTTPIDRFMIQVVSTFLDRLLIDDNRSYEQLHNEEYTELDLETLQDAFRYTFDKLGKNDRNAFETIFKKLYYRKVIETNPYDFTFKQMIPVLTMMLEGSYNLTVHKNTDRKKMTTSLSFIRDIILY